jgi:hypothetical protein
MPRVPTTGRASIFRGKESGVRVQGVLTRKGGQHFEVRRRMLAKLYREVFGRAPATVSDADVIEFLAIGEEATRAYLAALHYRLEER